MPVAVAALDWAADLPASTYSGGEAWAVHAGKVWQASGDPSWCDSAPGTAAGGRCWQPTPWRPTDLGKARPGLDLGAGKGQAPPAEKRYTPGGRPAARWVAHPAKNTGASGGEWLPYSTGDVAKAGGEWWRCGPAPDAGTGKQSLAAGDTREKAAQRCRGTAPSAATPKAKAAWTQVSAKEKAEFGTAKGKAREVKLAALPEKGERQQQALAFAPAKADYAEGAEVAWPLVKNAATDYASAWRCAASACAKAAEPTAAGGWKQLRARAEVVAKAPATVEAHEHEEGRPYYAGDKVVVGGEPGKLGGRAYECAKAGTPAAKLAGACAQHVPGRPLAAGQVSPWARVAGAAKSKGAEVRKEVDVMPLDALLACGVERCALRAGQAFSYGGAVLECAQAEKACADALTGLAATFAADARAAAAEPTWKVGPVRVPATKDAAGKAVPASTKPGKVATYPPRKDLEAELRTALLAGAGGKPAAFKVKAGAKPKPAASGDAGQAGKYKGVDAKDPKALVAAGVALACAQSALPGGQADGKGTGAAKMPGKAAGAQEAWRWLAGDLYCDAVSGKAWRCKPPGVACGAGVDPTWPTLAEAEKLRTTKAKSADGKVDYGKAKDGAAALKLLEGVHEAKLKTTAYADAWEPVEGAAEKLFVRLEDTQAAQNATKTKAFAWADVAAAGYTGTAEFAAGDVTLDGARLWKCVGGKDACKATQPTKQGTSGAQAWALTTLVGEAYTAEEALAASPAVVQCYLWEGGYPVQKGDAVCDPDAPEKRAWTCLSALGCPDARPSLKDAGRLATTWALATTSQRTDASGKTTTGLKQRFEKVGAPKEAGAPVQCQDWDDREKGSAAKDLGTALTWCDRGRVFKCVEAPQVTAAVAAVKEVKDGAGKVTTKAVAAQPAKEARGCCSGDVRPGEARPTCW
jgi:hypothetical protein